MHVLVRTVLCVMIAGTAGLMGYLVAYVIVHSATFPSAAWLRLVQVVCVGAAAGAAGGLAWTPDEESTTQRFVRLTVCSIGSIAGGYIAVEATVENDSAAAQGIRWLLVGSVLGTNLASLSQWLNGIRSGRIQTFG